ncbi:peptidase inhibitor 15-like [Paramisgurnus dabryanus]|uniref:peptidase inhibitor 15-like n=1 Tax=Paramisgurnus dabryanus TaxID=90735 RepID=UPI0031F477E8
MHLHAALRNAGLWILLSLASGHLTEDQASDIVDIHNDLRSQVQPSAAFMQKVVWNEELRLVAESYAAKCIWDHNPALPNLTMGENLFVTTGPLNITKAMLDWFEENRDYDFDSNSCNEGKMCGHYTQMVWATSTKIGCAAHLCETIEGLNFKKATLLVCDYYPSGNYEGQRPYEQGKSCSKCPEELPLCAENICVKLLPSEESESDATQPTVPPDTAQEPTAVTKEDTTEDTKTRTWKEVEGSSDPEDTTENTKIQKFTTSRSEVERSSAPEHPTEDTKIQKFTTSRSKVERSSAPEDTMEDTKIPKVTTSRSEVERSSAPLLMGVWILAALIL